MKSSLVIAALAAATAAKVHRAKLHKVPLEEQFENANIRQHAQALGQKYLGARPDAAFRDTSVDMEGGTPVPIENFLNAQCERCTPMNRAPPPTSEMLMRRETRLFTNRGG